MSYDPINDGPDPSEARAYGGMSDEKFIAYLLAERLWFQRLANAFAEEAGLTYKHVRYLEICRANQDPGGGRTR